MHDFQDKSVTWDTLISDGSPKVDLLSVIQGALYDISTTRLTNDKSKAAHYGLKFYLPGLFAKEGCMIGSMDLVNLDIISSESNRIIDVDARRNFGSVIVLPHSEEIPTSQQGCFFLEVEDRLVHREPEERTIGQPLPFGWTLAANDSWILGYIHGGRPVHLSSSRHPGNLISSDGSRLRATGREIAICQGSGAYEIHTSRTTGEVMKFIGAPPGDKYNIPEALATVTLYTRDKTHRDSLSWLWEMRDTLEDGEVVVQTLERLVNGRWVKLREINQTPDQST